MDENLNQNLKDSLKETFNFEEHQLKDPQTTEEEKNDKKPQEDVNKPKYDKSIDFFDSITNSTRLNEQGERVQRDDIRKRDAETFGF